MCVESFFSVHRSLYRLSVFRKYFLPAYTSVFSWQVFLSLNSLYFFIETVQLCISSCQAHRANCVTCPRAVTELRKMGLTLSRPRGGGECPALNLNAYIVFKIKPNAAKLCEFIWE